jgi:hypothetical protein
MRPPPQDPLPAAAGQFPRLMDAPPAGAAPGLPFWDPIRRRLWLGDRLLLAFGRRAPVREALLAACQARGWAAGYHEQPLPPEHGEPPDQVRGRVHEAVRNLNARLARGTLRFHQDPAGTGVWWEVGPPPDEGHAAG